MSEVQGVSNPTPNEGAVDTVEAAQDPNADLPKRWEVELEFVQSLANLQYLSYIVQNGYLKDDKFVNYLAYLTYWQEPEYAKHIVYPDCLHILTLLQSERFRAEIGNPNLTNALFVDMVDYWKEEIYREEKAKGAAEAEAEAEAGRAAENVATSAAAGAAAAPDVLGNSDLISPQADHLQLQTSMSPTSTEG